MHAPWNLSSELGSRSVFIFRDSSRGRQRPPFIAIPGIQLTGANKLLVVFLDYEIVPEFGFGLESKLSIAA